MDMSMSKLWEVVKDREARHAFQQSMVLQRVGQDWNDLAHTYTISDTGFKAVGKTLCKVR